MALLAAGVVCGPVAAHADGWVVVTPPVVQVGQRVVVNTSADLGTWMLFGPVPNFEACYRMLQSFRDTPVPPGDAQDVRSALGLQKVFMQCMPDNTPGLPRR